MYIFEPITDLPLKFQRAFSTLNYFLQSRKHQKAEGQADQIIDVVANEELHASRDARSLTYHGQPFLVNP